MMTAFAHPWLLTAALPVILIALYAWYRKQPGIRIPSLNTVKQAASKSKKTNWKRLVPFLLYTAAMLLLVVALARPREGLEQINRRAEGIDIIVALDLSGSMKAIDIPRTMPHRKSLEQRDVEKQNRHGEKGDRKIHRSASERPHRPDRLCSPAVYGMSADPGSCVADCES